MKLYHEVNSFRDEYKKQETFLKNDDRSLVTTQEKINEKRAAYFEKLLNCKEPLETSTDV